MHEDFRLKVFVTAAQCLSFSKASKELFISQPAVSKHIQEVEKQVGATLFVRNGRQLALTEQGKIMLQYSKEILGIYNRAEFEINALNNKIRGLLKVAASTTISHYILPPLLAGFSQKNPKVNIIAIEHNSLQVEEMLIVKEIDLGITEGLTNNPALKFVSFLEDELVLVTRERKDLPDQISLNKLKELSLVFREKGSGTRDVIENHLKKSNIRMDDLNCRITLPSTESIIHFLKKTNSFAFLSIHSIIRDKKDKDLKIIKIKGFRILRSFYFAHLHGELSGISQVFFHYCMKNKANLNNLKL